MDRRELLKQAVYDMCATCVFCIVATFAMAASAEVATSTVESGMGYSSWPMIQAVGDRIVCVYSRGTAHSIVQGVRDAFAKWSADGGRTWSQPVAVAASPEYGETPIGKGLDKDGAALFWIRAYGGGKPHHELYRTRDGEFFELVCTPELSPLPMQITDIFAVDNGLMCLWFATGYSSKVSNSSWGTLFSADNGRTWKQTAVESNLPLAELPTEPSVARLPDGKLICIARSETLKGDGARQWQMESADGGLTWTRKATNIRDVFASTPSLIFDVTSGLLYNYYYERGKGVLKRRVARPDSVVSNPLAWPEPEAVACGSDAPWDAGNANATSLGDTHYVAFYSGVEGDTSVVVAAVPTLLISSCDDALDFEHCHATGELQEKAQALADLAVKEGMQGALQFCAFKDGKCIVDVWAGTMTTNAGAAKIDGNTLFPIFSTEKPMLATAVHRSVEQGRLEYDRPVSDYWPEFRGGGKEKLTVRELMGYRSGLPDCKSTVGWNDFAAMSDWKGMLEWYASSKPEIEPGTKQRYMPRSYGWALGGLLEKAWGCPANDILRNQVLIPAGIENDFYFVCGDREISRIATVYNGKVFESMNNDIARRSLLPSAWAVSSARGIAKFYNRLCGFDGQPPLVSKSTLDAALKPCRHESDPLPDAEGLEKWHMIFGMGYGLWGGADDISRVFGHGGVGGSEGLCDRSQRLVVGYTCNFAGAPPKLREAFYSLVGMRWRYWKDDVNIQDLQMATVAKGNDASANSVASFCERAKKGDRLTVAFLGGSLSWGANATDPNKASWRALVGRRLEERYPDAHFKFIDAAIGGTDSGLGIFRLERDVISYKPDIVFVEWLVNDGVRKADDDCSCSYEGIVRHIMDRLPGCVPVQVMLPTRGTIEEPDASKLVRWDEQKRTGAAYGLVSADVLGEMRRRHAAGTADLDRMWPAWPALLGDTTHPHDYGYSVYADIIWNQIFAKPSDKSPTMPDEWLFAPKYRHVVRENVAAWKNLPKGWHNDACYVRAGTFDFLCSRWQDGLAVAANCVFNPKTRKRELVSGDVEPLRAKFRGEVLMLYGESAEWSPKCEVFVDGKRVAERATSDFGRMFAPTAYLVWKIGGSFDANAEHTLEIRPVFADGEPQEFRLGSICVAGRNAAWVASAAAMPPRISVEGVAAVALGGNGVVTVTSTGAVSFVRLKLKESLAPEVKVLNDAWERSYGDLKWQTLGTNTICSPWYFLAEKDGKVKGFGVETGPDAMCCWEISAKGVTLVLDVRAGGRPVRLDGRTLKACRIVRSESDEGETPWQFGRRFCRMMCPNPKLPKEPVYGYNDWYCAYGKNTATNFLADAAAIVSLCDGLKVRPYVVMDDGWQRNSPPVVHESGRGPWDAAGANFGMDMPEFCGRIAALGAKPGLWYRPLRAWDELPDGQRLMANRKYLDPTVPAVKARIAEDVRRFRDWGFKLVKIDFLSYDISQLWPCDAHPFPELFIQDDRAWRDDSRTTAEVMRDLYETMKDAAGDDVVIIGCNALNHLAAGVFELQRTGNDTSGKNWAWTKNHGVNTLAMRSIQDGAFFKVDADCVGLASEGAVPWALNRQWMELLGRSGTPFFVSWSRALMDDDVRAALREAFKAASEGRPTAHAEDWQTTPIPRRWSVGTFDWGGARVRPL